MMNTTNTPASSDDMALDLGRLLSAIGASLKWLVPLVFIVAGCVFVVVSFMPSKYRGEAKVLIESTDAKFPGAARGVEGERALLDAEGVASQVQLLMSADLARRVAKKLDLASEPEFEAARGGPLISDALAMLGLSSGGSRSSVEEKVLKHYYKNLEVFRLEGSRVIAVRYSAENPELAASVANMVVDEYIALQARAKRDTTEVAATAMEPQIEQLRKEVQAAGKAVEDFRARADLLIGTDNLTLNQKQLADISTQYSAAQANSAESQAKADLVRELLKSGGSLETASDVLNSQLIQRLRERQVALQFNIAELSITLLPNHPQLKALNSQLADYNRQIRAEARKVLVGLENDAKLARQQAAALEGRLNELKSAAARSNADQVRLNELEREANAKASQLDTLLTSFRDADMRLRAQALPADARIISRASVPVEPYAPKVMAITIISALVALVLGCAFVILREFLSGNVLYSTRESGGARRRDAHLAGANWNTSYSAGEPAFMSMSGSVGSAGMHVGANADRNDRPEFRSDDAGFQPAPPANRPDRFMHDDRAREGFGATMPTVPGDECVAVLSVDDAPAAQRLAIDLARQATRGGGSVLYLEVLPERADPKAAAGFSDLVAGEAAFSSIVYQDGSSKTHIIESGRRAIPDGAAESERFRHILDSIDRTYDTIIVSLGTIDGTLASAKLLGFADRVLVAAAEEDYGQELVSAAKLLERNTGSAVEIISLGSSAPRKKRRPFRGRAA